MRILLAIVVGAIVGTAGLLVGKYLQLHTMINSADSVQVHNGTALLKALLGDWPKMLVLFGLVSAIYLVPLVSYIIGRLRENPFARFYAAVIAYIPIGLLSAVFTPVAKASSTLESLLLSHRDNAGVLLAGVAIGYCLSPNNKLQRTRGVASESSDG